jgi:hypothetical protein
VAANSSPPDQHPKNERLQNMTAKHPAIIERVRDKIFVSIKASHCREMGSTAIDTVRNALTKSFKCAKAVL